MTASRFDKKLFLLSCLALALGTLALYWPTTGYPFINFDDDDYVTDNSTVKAGLTWAGIKWAFNGAHAANWHPLTWISHMMDCQLFGLNAGGHHLMAVLFHTTNALLLFTFLRYTTAAPWRSAFVATLFAWHPLRVESVVWIAERKDVLCAFFWLLSLLAYARYAKKRETNNQTQETQKKCGFFRWYFAALLFCACAMLSKPMAVTLPFTLLLLDFWPLGRIQNEKFKIKNWGALLLEKIPFFFISFALCVVTFVAQRGSGAVSPVEWSSRLGNIPIAYARYLSKTLWPTDLTIVYPYVYRWPVPAIIGSVLLLAVFSTLAVMFLRRKPWLPVGWFWFLGTLVPVIGIVQVGAQSMADRYSYIPSIGLLIVLVWGIAEICTERSNGKFVLGLIGGSALIGCLLATSLQITCWRNSATLFLHALEVTQNNYVADNALGKAFEKSGDNAKALVLYREAVRLEPRYAVSQYNLGIALIGFGKKDEALEHLAAAARLDPGNANAQFNLGVFFLQSKRWLDAQQCFEATLKLQPDSAPAHFHLGEALLELGKFSDAAVQFHAALRLQPDLADAKKSLDALLLAHPEVK